MISVNTKKEKIEFTLTAILVMVFIVAVTRAGLKIASSRSPYGEAAHSPYGEASRSPYGEASRSPAVSRAIFGADAVYPLPSVKDIRQNELIKKREEIINNFAERKWGRSPFSEVAYGSLAGYELMGVFWDEASPYVIINREVLRVGEAIDEYQVMEIEKTRVILTDGESQYTLEVMGE